MIRTDLHVHSCLSPCGSEEMDPFDVVGMAKICGIQLLALTDHNSARNCPAAAVAAAEYGSGFIPGIEVNTSEDIHCVCLFPGLKEAMEFDRFLYAHIPDIANRPQIFGEQIIVHPDGSREPEPKLLLTGCDISILDLPQMVEARGGLCWPAHVDRDANGLFAMLGTWPEELQVPAAEIRQTCPEGVPGNLKLIQASDAHDFQTLAGGGFPLPLETADFAGLEKYVGRKGSRVK